MYTSPASAIEAEWGGMRRGTNVVCRSEIGGSGIRGSGPPLCLRRRCLHRTAASSSNLRPRNQVHPLRVSSSLISQSTLKHIKTARLADIMLCSIGYTVGSGSGVSALPSTLGEGMYTFWSISMLTLLLHSLCQFLHHPLRRLHHSPQELLHPRILHLNYLQIRPFLVGIRGDWCLGQRFRGSGF
ncbi:hypothetical protein L873DRAFT_1060482 [Choiromyces venosus 120613-1]|uniref:Uncharacterized protein n=1 Tax=Choiromyces venosus 120613-1 TaxID=1336337 RepID=A0A3N4JIW0_9PEZI|nr:hypothetical protein L873DRAFT_1060482 [Choiromyces venosus 120613-1]